MPAGMPAIDLRLAKAVFHGRILAVGRVGYRITRIDLQRAWEREGFFFWGGGRSGEETEGRKEGRKEGNQWNNCPIPDPTETMGMDQQAFGSWAGRTIAETTI